MVNRRIVVITCSPSLTSKNQRAILPPSKQAQVIWHPRRPRCTRCNWPLNAICTSEWSSTIGRHRMQLASQCWAPDRSHATPSVSRTSTTQGSEQFLDKFHSKRTLQHIVSPLCEFVFHGASFSSSLQFPQNTVQQLPLSNTDLATFNLATST